MPSNDFNEVFDILSKEYEEDETLRQNIDVDFRMPDGEISFTGKNVVVLFLFIPGVYCPPVYAM